MMTLKYTCSACVLFERKLSLNLISRLQNHGLLLGWLCHLYLNGRYQDAYTFTMRALLIQERSYGKDHIGTARAIGNLGSILSKLGRRQESKQWHLRCLDIKRRVYGKGHRENSSTLHNLGYLCVQLNELDSAADCATQELAIDQRVHGEGHRETVHGLELFIVIWATDKCTSKTSGPVCCCQQLSRSHNRNPTTGTRRIAHIVEPTLL